MEEEQRRINKMKTYAIEVFFDNEFDSYVRNLWSKCDLSEISVFMNRIENAQFFNPTELPDQISPLIRANINELLTSNYYNKV